MRKSTLDRLRCARCGAGSLVPEADVAGTALTFGPAKCVGCGARFPVHDGLIDLVGDRERLTRLQRAMEHPVFARSWDRYVRPALDGALTRGRLDLESELTVLQGLLGAPQGPLVDVGCGSGLLLRKLARVHPELALVGVDVSRPMLEEAMAQLREAGAAADFVRAQVPPLPFNAASVGSVIAVGFTQFVRDLDGLLAEAARVLRPRGRLVGTSYEVGARTLRFHHAAGLSPHDEQTLRRAAQRHGFIAFERVRVAPFLLWKIERP